MLLYCCVLLKKLGLGEKTQDKLDMTQVCFLSFLLESLQAVLTFLKVYIESYILFVFSNSHNNNLMLFYVGKICKVFSFIYFYGDEQGRDTNIKCKVQRER